MGASTSVVISKHGKVALAAWRNGKFRPSPGKVELFWECDDMEVEVGDTFQEVKNTLFCPLQEKVHTVVFKGCQKYFWRPAEFPE